MKRTWSGMNFRNGMHCLGAVAAGSSGGLSNNGISGNCGGVLSVVRALGVLVCEGRIQGSPRGYKEGPHCTAPLQSSPNHHQCDKENYLCNRYLVLVKEIADRTAIGASLCVEVFMCSNCQCGLSTVTSNDPVSPLSFTSITQWPHSCEMLLEYWCIGIVPTKSSEMMNSQGLYQAVRSRLHFSQVAAWWSRSNGTKPAYVATRIVPYNIDNRRKFRETPIKHEFPLASIGDGYSVEVTVWALPRMEDVPTIICPVHLPKDNMKDDECTARALTPTKNIVPSSRIDAGLVLPSLVDDRLQTPCNKPGKHHCHCEDEDGSPPSPSIKPNGERKRRRSLPCGPPDANSSTTLNNLPLASVSESNSLLNSMRDVGKTPRERERAGEISGYDNRPYLGTGNLERCFKTQVSLEAPEGNVEKRYKPSSDMLTTETSFNNGTAVTDDIEKFKSFVPFIESQSPVHSLENRHNGDGRKSLSPNEKTLVTATFTTTTMTPTTSDAVRLHYRLPMSREPNLVVNPFAERSTFHESNPGPSTLPQQSTLRSNNNSKSMSCTVHLDYLKSNKSSCSYKLEKEDVKKNSDGVGKDLSSLMSKLSFPKESSHGKTQREESRILDWISKVPSRVLNGSNSSGGDEKKIPDDLKCDQELQQQQNQNHQVRNAIKFNNCNLELSQREFNEVLAVLRARTPSARRRTPVKTLRRRERAEKPSDESSMERNSMRYVPLERCVCPIHREIQSSTNLLENNICQLCKNSTAVHRFQVHPPKMNNDVSGDRTPIGKSSDPLQNVANKADVLLGAILRTSSDRKGLSDISNGARPRTNSSHKESMAPTTTAIAIVDKREERKNISTDEHGESRIVDLEGDKFLPSVLNKRLSRFKQLFRKEQDKKETIEIPNTKQYRPNNDFLGNAINTNKIKRTITKSPVTINKSSVSYEPLVNDNSNAEQGNLHLNSTNYKFNEINNQSMDASNRKDSAMSSMNRGDKSEHDNATIIDEDTAEKKNMDREIKGYQNKMVIDESGDILEDETADKAVPSAIEQERFRRSLENAASMVFHSRTGLPLTSSPAPLRRGSCCFDYDSSLNSVSSKRSALFALNTPPSPGALSLEEADREVEYCGEGDETPKRLSSSRSRPQSHALLGSFEESALNGRLEPVSTVHGFTAEIGASGSFCPKHRKLPVTVFFYTLGDNDKVSTPYLAHLNLGKKGYQVPRSGTIQVTLSNPLGTVVKMFVVLYDLSDMPPRSHTFLRQRTLRDKTLRYLIHLRFMSGKSGRIYLHTDIRIIICRRSDVDTASDFSTEPPKELRSYIHGPTNPKFSPRC